jgi:hypothetical protein
MTKEQIRLDPRVHDGPYKDIEGLWMVVLKSGYCWAPATHLISESNLKDVLRCMRTVRPCSCPDCAVGDRR